MTDRLPLFDLFNRLREAGLPLGLDEYHLFLRALQAGFGQPDREALRRLCATVWVNSPDECRLLDYHFDQVLPPPVLDAPVVPAEPAPPDLESPRDAGRLDRLTRPETATQPPREARESTVSAPASKLTLDLQDETLALQAALEATKTDEDIPYTRFVANAEYFPVTTRQMKQSWRHLRRMVRDGPPTELDVRETVRTIGRQGVLLAPVLIPRRINRTQLLLLVDQDGSMAPFHALSRRLSETAARGGRLGKAGIYYFHNCPANYLYQDMALQSASELEEILTALPQDRTGVLIFSDAGAARGGFNPERLVLTAIFLNHVKKVARYSAWLNPLPHSRWDGTTAEYIARLIPMFEFSRAGLDHAIDVLRGRML